MPREQTSTVDRVPPKSPWLSPSEAAFYLGVTIGHVRNLTSRREIPFARRGRIVRYRSDLLDEWLALDMCHGRSHRADRCDGKER